MEYWDMSQVEHGIRSYNAEWVIVMYFRDAQKLGRCDNTKTNELSRDNPFLPRTSIVSLIKAPAQSIDRSVANRCISFLQQKTPGKIRLNHK